MAREVADLESSTLGGKVDETAIQELPLSSRNYTQILGLSPGISVGLPNAAELGRGTQNVSSDGGKTTANNIQFNGIDANNLAQNSAANDGEEVGTAIPAPDAIQEFRVQTANFDAAYGRGAGANVDLISKGGSNRFHGSAWEFVRNNLFNANEFFLKREGARRPDLKQNQFGASVGGPVRKDRTFFFAAYQGLTEVNGLGGKQTATLPLLTADRSAASLGAQFCPAGHLDNSGQAEIGYLTHAGGIQVACDGSNISPVALAILNAKLANGRVRDPQPTDPSAVRRSGSAPRWPVYLCDTGALSRRSVQREPGPYREREKYSVEPLLLFACADHDAVLAGGRERAGMGYGRTRSEYALRAWRYAHL